MTRCARRRAGMIASFLLQSAAIVVPGAAAATAPLPTLRPGPDVGARVGTNTPLPWLRPEDEDLGTGSDVATPLSSNIPIPFLLPDDLAVSEIVSNQEFFTLRGAITALRKNDFATAQSKRGQLHAPVAGTLFDWLFARDRAFTAGYARIAAFLRAHPDWPNRDLLRARMETVLFEQGSPTEAVIAAFRARTPETGPGKAAFAFALLERGEKAEAAKWIRDAWENHTLSPDQEKRILAKFPGVLTKQNHKARLDLLLCADHSAAAMRAAKRLGKEAVELAKARAAVAKRSRSAGKLLGALKGEIRKDPVALLSRIQWLRRDDKDAEAAKLMLTVPRDGEAATDVWQWWVERRILTRRMLDRHEAEKAYKIAAGHVAEDGLAFAEGEFLAGWVALRYLNKPQTALTHFEALRGKVTTDLSLSRAHYWLGRTFEALKRIEDARANYEYAARYETTYYGQLARLKLGMPAALSLNPSPQPTAEEQERFSGRELVRAARLLGELGEKGLARTFLIELASSLHNPVEIALAGQLARDFGLPHVALRMGKIAAARNRPVPELAFLTEAVPEFKSPGKPVEPALVHAVARQESSFNAAAISPAGARGLMQMMPATAKRTARDVGLVYSPDRLTADPAYNAALGAAHLGQLVTEFDGSYVMTIAAYNAGGPRVRKWVAAFGDPRRTQVDPIDWIERIPFSETRNYVQRVLESLQVYRARLNGDTHPIELVADLTRGRGPNVR